MRRKLFAFFVLLAAACTVWGGSSSALSSFIIPISESEFYSETYTLYSLLGLASPSYSQPWTGSEAEIILSRAESPAAENSFAQKLLSSLQSRLESYRPKFSLSDDFNYEAGVTASPEIYLHANTEEYVNDSDWFYNYDKRQKLLTLGLEFSVRDFFYTYSELALTKSRYA